MRILLALLFLSSIAHGQTYIPQFRVSNITGLKALKGVANSVQYVLGKDSARDGRGGMYYWDSTSVATNDDFNVVQVTGQSLGRWIRNTQTQNTYPTGTLFRIGALRLFIGTCTTNASGVAVINATEDGTSTGIALFPTSIYSTVGQIPRAGQEALVGKPLAYPAGLKVISIQFVTASLLGVVTVVPTGQAGTFFIVGM